MGGGRQLECLPRLLRSGVVTGCSERTRGYQPPVLLVVQYDRMIPMNPSLTKSKKLYCDMSYFTAVYKFTYSTVYIELL